MTNEARDVISLHTALVDLGALTEAQLGLVREKVRQQMKSSLESQGADTPEKLVAALRKFEGPLQ